MKKTNNTNMIYSFIMIIQIMLIYFIGYDSNLALGLIISGNVILITLGIIYPIIEFLYKRYKNFFVLVFTTIVSIIVSYGIKIITKIPRPDTIISDPNLLTIGEMSFPSTHVTIITSLSVILYKNGIVKDKHTIIPLIILVCFSRWYAKLHHLSDVLFGCIIGFIIGYIIWRLLLKSKNI